MNKALQEDSFVITTFSKEISLHAHMYRYCTESLHKCSRTINIKSLLGCWHRNNLVYRWFILNAFGHGYNYSAFLKEKCRRLIFKIYY